MTVRNLKFMFKPSSVALIGASQKPSSIGAVVARNLLGAGFEGEIFPVNPKYKTIEGILCYPDVVSLPKPPDLAVIATPPASVPGLIAELLGTDLPPVYEDPRPGDVLHSHADLTSAGEILEYKPIVDLREGLERTVDYFREIAR